MIWWKYSTNALHCNVKYNFYIVIINKCDEIPTYLDLAKHFSLIRQFISQENSLLCLEFDSCGFVFIQCAMYMDIKASLVKIITGQVFPCAYLARIMWRGWLRNSSRSSFPLSISDSKVCDGRYGHIPSNVFLDV